MKSLRRFLFLLPVILVSTITAPLYSQSNNQPATAQESKDPEGFVRDPDGKFTLQLPNKGWVAIYSRDGLNRPQLDIIYRVREDGNLEVRQLTVEAGAKMIDVATKDEQTLSFQAPGYAKGSIEGFGARGDAAVLTYDYTRGGKPLMGRRYYLRVNDNTVFVLRFTGNRNTLGPLRSQTDAIARSIKAL